MVRVLIKGGIWKNSEDEILKSAIMKYGKNNWARVSSLMTRKSAKQCKARWFEWLDPSIKKTEFTKQEDEKLLHLVKIMPTQWNTIAGAMNGRTATMCLERYEKLLDLAAEARNKKDLNVSANSQSESLSALKALKPGDIEPNPESKPARPDPVDMDDEEKEMLSEARARLANTKGKKAKRKAREKHLEVAKRLAILQKTREMKAAGLTSGGSESHNGVGLVRKLMGYGNTQMNAKKKRRNGVEIDYLDEIPFERQVPLGIYDISGERKLGEDVRLDPEQRRDMVNKMNSEIDSRKDRSKQSRDKLNRNISSLKEHGNSEKVLELELRELEREQVARRLLSHPKNIKKLELPPPKLDESGLRQLIKTIGEDKFRLAAKTIRTPLAENSVLEESKAQLLKSQLQTPLLETDETLQLRNDDERQARKRKSPSLNMLEELKSHADTPLVANQGSKRSKLDFDRKLKSLFSQLPTAKDEYELVTKVELNENPLKKSETTAPEDLGDIQRAKRYARKLEAEERKLRLSSVVQQNLVIPTPVVVNKCRNDEVGNKMFMIILEDYIKNNRSNSEGFSEISASQVKIIEENSYVNECSLADLNCARDLVSQELLHHFGTEKSLLEACSKTLNDFNNFLLRQRQADQNEIDSVKVEVDDLSSELASLEATVSQKRQSALGKVEEMMNFAKEINCDFKTQVGTASNVQDKSLKHAAYKNLLTAEETIILNRIQELRSLCLEVHEQNEKFRNQQPFNLR